MDILDDLVITDECDEGCDCLESDEEDEDRICGIHLFSGECDETCLS